MDSGSSSLDDFKVDIKSKISKTKSIPFLSKDKNKEEN